MILGLKQLKLAASILASAAKAGDQTGIATAIDLALKSTDFGETLRKQDPLAIALRDVSAKLEEATRKALSGEFGADWESNPDLAATLAALPDVLECYAPDTDAIFAENLDPERIAGRATDAAEAAHDERAEGRIEFSIRAGPRAARAFAPLSAPSCAFGNIVQKFTEPS